jgi:N-acetylglucosaminyldiphosphoundecaprenol N-acetyl-beta-D-mannosaminyltransferase
MTDHGLEWLGRLIIEPRRLWWRYLVGNPLFLWRVLKQQIALRQGRRGGGG